MIFFFYFLCYSFLGFGLEVAFAWVSRNPKKDRKCFFILPLCPVYGLGALAILCLPDSIQKNPWLLLLFGGAVATGAEYLMGLFYEKVAGVAFWDYSHLPANLGGKVCLLFSGAWGVLAVLFLRYVHPSVAVFCAAIPPLFGVPVLALVLLDAARSLVLLRRSHSTSSLIWYRH